MGSTVRSPHPVWVVTVLQQDSGQGVTPTRITSNPRLPSSTEGATEYIRINPFSTEIRVSFGGLKIRVQLDTGH